MKAKKVFVAPTYRIYEVSEPIKKGKSDWVREVSIDETIESYMPRIKEKYKECVASRKGKGVEYVAISDANTHIERLAFPAFKFGETYGFLCDDIAGKHTYLTEGGDPDSVYEDAVYLRFLAKINGLKWEGLE
jgi:hypothetical protein